MRTIYIDDETLAALRAHMTPEAWLPLMIAAETGLRIGDVVALRWNHLQGRCLTYIAAKTRKPGRVRLSAAAIKALNDYRPAGAADRAQPGAGSQWVFPGRDPGKHITRQAIWARVKSAASKAGIDPDGVAPHSFRKHFAVELYNRSGLLATQAALQHDRATTTEIYALSDFSTGRNADLPLRRRDLPFIIELVAAAVSARNRERPQ